LIGGKVAFLNEGLLYYRRHDNNASRTKSLTKQIYTRLELLMAHLIYALRQPNWPSEALPGKQTERG
jgi:hypothetical protein